MDTSIEHLKSLMVFAQVADSGSFSAAGRQLGLTRAVVSYHIRKLEEAYGLKLFHRAARSLKRTEAGDKLLGHCKVILRETQAAQRAIERYKQEPEGTLRISCPVSVGLERMVPILGDFHRLYPKIRLNVSFSDDVADLLGEGFDLAIRGAPMPDSDLRATKLATITTCLCAAPAYFETRPRPGSIDELMDHSWVLHMNKQKVEILLKDGSSKVFEPEGSITTNNALSRTAFVQAGHGIARIPRYDADPKIRAGLLEEVLPGTLLPEIQIYGVFPPGAAMSGNLRLLLDFTKQVFQDQARL